ncbi:hypothetical protein PPROV_001104800 [Pycnococcus provasolii]|uniref:Nucleotide-diphospho-sugar transferase domain-containing protein n=1 Tax=Pycnococcus provasolii TaxID=41880 RepID=A0A830I2Q5_9CHLO|nr:hypothetical protein PPROV_001104800 [Pycnococcus provasolii]
MASSWRSLVLTFSALLVFFSSVAPVPPARAELVSVYGNVNTVDPNEKGITYEKLLAKFKTYKQSTVVVWCIEDVFWGEHPTILQTLTSNTKRFMHPQVFRPFFHSTRKSTCERVTAQTGFDCEVVTYADKFTRDPRSERLWIDRVWVLKTALEAGKIALMMDVDVRFMQHVAPIVDPDGPYGSIDIIFQGTGRRSADDDGVEGDGIFGFCAGFYLLRPTANAIKMADYTLKEMHIVRHNPYINLPSQYKQLIGKEFKQRLVDATSYDQDVMFDSLVSLLESRRVQKRKLWGAQRVANEESRSKGGGEAVKEEHQNSLIVRGAKATYNADTTVLFESADGTFRALASGMTLFVGWHEHHGENKENACMRFKTYTGIHCSGRPPRCLQIDQECSAYLDDKPADEATASSVREADMQRPFEPPPPPISPPPAPEPLRRRGLLGRHNFAPHLPLRRSSSDALEYNVNDERQTSLSLEETVQTFDPRWEPVDPEGVKRFAQHLQVVHRHARAYRAAVHVTQDHHDEAVRKDYLHTMHMHEMIGRARDNKLFRGVKATTTTTTTTTATTTTTMV